MAKTEKEDKEFNYIFLTNRPALKPRTQSSSSLTPVKRHDDSG